MRENKNERGLTEHCVALSGGKHNMQLELSTFGGFLEGNIFAKFQNPTVQKLWIEW
jgi:hypothetical protein